MRDQYFKKGIPLFFLLLFLGVKASAFHPLTHEETEETVLCEVCTLVIQQELDDFDHPELQTVPEEVPVTLSDEELTRYFIHPYHKDIWMRFFSRPPPQLA
ncbi:hypothetical protein [Lentiprolixibacter aurantiacus]|uniref:Uncharacterized protein n=1 Tax=Lentiprolixibacter aurantiacus TaxID=2993939 RepID=A0AAE3SMW0_9FLAO|nr:hypothetical protein [Lentiprolixibacter aurantiacus]MCX2718875.1 hypothetical protein [Lentiprolixibacter aurantiacus]